MNKKFSTLVASLLLSSAFSVYAGNAKPMLATPTQVETRATSADVEEAVEWNGTLNVLANNFTGKVFPGFTNNARLFVARQNVPADFTADDSFVKYDDSNAINEPVSTAYPKTNDGTSPVESAKFYWTLKNGQLVDNVGHIFTVEGASSFEVIPVKNSTQQNAPTYWFVLGTRNAADGSLKYVGVTATGTSTFSLVNNLAQAATFCSIETEYQKNLTVSDLNDEEGTGFHLSISSKIDELATVIDADVFGGKIQAVETGSPSAYKLYVPSVGKYIVFDMNGSLTSDPNALKGKFKLVDNPDASGLLDRFCVASADNGSNETIVEVIGYHAGGVDVDAPNNGIENYRLYIANVSGTYALTIADYWAQKPANNTINVMDWAATSLGDGNLVDLREFLTGEFYTIDFVKSLDNPVDVNDEYKKGGRLAILDNQPDFVPVTSLYDKAPEAQWAVSSNNGVSFDGTITFTNRENPSESFVITKLRRTSDGFEVAGVSGTTGVQVKDVVKINAVTEHSKTDGYAVFNANDLRNKTWNLGQVRQAEGDAEVNVYWAENHGTHQIGATVEEENASRWNLSLVNKFASKHETETDSILVVSELQTWNITKNRIDAKKDTLVILPYAFQNRANNEYVVMNDQKNLEYYICDKDNKEEARYAQRFALKMKADGTYNYVALESFKNNGFLPTYQPNGAVWTKSGKYADNKVFQENSTLLGTWSDMPMYSKDANSLMFVKEATAPEYRKLVSENGVDTVRIYRADNHSQVVYEKRDAKSVVEGRTLSFLNIDNETQFTEINPALYVDTAYVNRGNNTRYQYLLGVNVTEHKGYYCEDHGFAEERPCEHAVPVAYKTGRYLINMIDTANVYGANVNIHNNPYINETEEGLDCAKLSFVDAIHVLEDADATKTDKLYIINNADSKDKYTVIDLSTPDFNIAKFAFKYVDSMEGEEFKIQTLYKEYIAPLMEGATDADFRAAYANNGSLSSEEGYLRWVNGCLVVDKTYQKGDVFDMNEDETCTPTANEEIATSSVVVAGTNGAVVVKGAEGKNVIVSTILGKVVANEVVSSDNATIAAPQGVVVVSVDGESFKVVVK